MSLFPAVMTLLVNEAGFRSINGSLMLIGRQTIEQSKQTDKEFFASFTGAKFHALDVSDYEGADVIHDLNKPLPDSLRRSTDFVFDGSCLDNIFDVGTAMRSLSQLLKSDGRIILMEHGTAIQSALTVFSPEWFFNFFAANDYADCQIILGMFPMGMRKNWMLQLWEPFDEHDNPVPASICCGDFVNLVIAEKGPNSTDDQIPIQAQYRRRDKERYLAAHHRFRNGKRRSYLLARGLKG